jgi:hypothetical protein
MKDKIEVSKIDIKIGDKTISLRPEQAKELKKILNEMFEESHDKVIHEHRYWWWNQPYYTNPYPYWTITAGSTLGNSATGGYATNGNGKN